MWITQVVAECVPDGRTNHGDRPTALRVELYSWLSARHQPKLQNHGYNRQIGATIAFLVTVGFDSAVSPNLISNMFCSQRKKLNE